MSQQSVVREVLLASWLWFLGVCILFVVSILYVKDETFIPYFFIPFIAASQPILWGLYLRRIKMVDCSPGVANKKSNLGS